MEVSTSVRPQGRHPWPAFRRDLPEEILKGIRNSWVTYYTPEECHHPHFIDEKTGSERLA